MKSLKEQLMGLFGKNKQNRRNPKTESDPKERPGRSKHLSDDFKAGAAPLSKRTDREPTRESQGNLNDVRQPAHRSSTQAKETRGKSTTDRRANTGRKAQAPSTRKSEPDRPRTQENSKPAPNIINKPPATNLTAANDFKFPDQWVEAGQALQAPASRGGRPLSVRIGIDFGTAYTKVAVRLADSVFAIDFSAITGKQSPVFLLPGEISLDGENGAWLGRHPQSKKVISGLKIPFLTANETSLDGKVNAAMFLAWVMRYVRAWVFRNLTDIVSNRTLAWEINTGIPSNSWVDESLNSRYERVLLAAWEISKADKTPEWAGAREILLSPRPSFEDIGLDDLRLIPEFISQLAGYVLSPQRPEKGEELHLLVDIGAGTVDIACFGTYRPHKDDFYRFPTWASAVEPYGTHFLMATRYRELVSTDQKWDDFGGVPNPGTFAEMAGCSCRDVQKVDTEFAGVVSEAIGQVLTSTKRRKNPLAREWAWGIRTFLAGGGSHCEAYRDAVDRALKRLGTPIKEMKFELRDLNNRQNIESSQLHRLSVAYGLTFDADSIGEAIPPGDIDDVVAYADAPERPDRDDLYPR